MSKSIKNKKDIKVEEIELNELPGDKSIEGEDNETEAIQWANKLYLFKEYIYENPGNTRFDLIRNYKPLRGNTDCHLVGEYEFKKVISQLKFSGEIYEDEEGFIYARSKWSPSY